jgi:hypothetical protein
MRGRFKTWTRIRVNLQHVPEALRPAQEALDPNDTPNEWAHVDPEVWSTHRSRLRKPR